MSRRELRFGLNINEEEAAFNHMGIETERVGWGRGEREGKGEGGRERRMKGVPSHCRYTN